MMTIVMPTVNTMFLLMKEGIGVEQESGGMVAFQLLIVVPVDALVIVLALAKIYLAAEARVMVHLLVHTEARFKTGIHFRFACGKMEQLI
jgi:hypothetical protein